MLESISLAEPHSRFALYTLMIVVVNLLTVVAAVVFTSRMVVRSMEEMIDAALMANIEHPGRPLTVSFSPDYPALRDAYRTDYWVRAGTTSEVLLFHPTDRRWVRADGSARGIGLAIIDGALVSFRTVPTHISEEDIEALRTAITAQQFPRDLWQRLRQLDADEVFSVIEAMGLVREFNIVLERELPRLDEDSVGGLFEAMGRRRLDI